VIKIAEGEDAKIEVSGTLRTSGTEEYMVQFVSAAASPAANDWDWIKVNAGGTLDLDYCEVKHAYKGVWAYSDTTEDALSVSINHCRFDSMQSAGVEFKTIPTSQLSVQNSTIGKCGNYGINVASGFATIKGNTFTDEGGGTNYWCHVGDVMWPKSSALVESNVFDISGGWGVTGKYLQLPELCNDFIVQYNEILGGTGGIMLLCCSTSVSTYDVFLNRNVLTNEGSTSGYGILNWNTASKIYGDISKVKDSSQISGWQYGIAYYIYCVYPEINESTVRQLYFTDNNYHIWINDSSLVDIGKSYHGLWGNNYFGEQMLNEYTIYSLSPHTVYAEYNYWDGAANKRTYGTVDYTPALGMSPFSGGGSPLEKMADGTVLPESPSLAQNYPNPFNLGTQIQFSLATGGHVNIGIYNVLGQRICQLLDDEYPPGIHQVFWDGRDDDKRTVTAGVYFYKIQTADYVESKKMVVLK